MINGRDKLSVSKRFLVIEILCVTVISILLIKLFRSYIKTPIDWFWAPCVFIAAALVPTYLRKKRFSEIGLCVERPWMVLRVLLMTCIIVFPLFGAGIFLLGKFNIGPPLSPIIPEERWISWLAYQFMYVAVAEEIFFRGYFQSNIVSLLAMSVQKKRAFLEIIGIIISATVFAISHCLILGGIKPIITFFPGLIFGWLLVRTKSLLAPVLFHGLANMFNDLITTVLT